MDIIKRIDIKRSISSIKTVNGKFVGITDISNTFRLFSLNPIKLANGFKTGIPLNHPFIKNSSLSPLGSYAAFSFPKRGGVGIFSAKNNTLEHTLKQHKGIVECIEFHPKELYIATGGQDGRTFLWNLKEGSFISTISSQSDYVTSIAFSPNGIWIASGSYDKTITITNISSMHQSFKLRGHKGAITNLRFLKNRRLISTDKMGEVVVWDYMKAKVHKRLASMPYTVTDISLTKDEHFLFVGAKDGSIALYNLETYEKLSSKYIKLSSPITAIEYVQESKILIAGTKNGEVVFYDLSKDETALLGYVKIKAYKEAYILIEENPLLLFTKAYLRLEEAWKETVEEAKVLLQNGQHKEAKKILAPFTQDAKKRLFAQNFLKDFVEFDKFKKAANMKKYSLLYSLVNQYPTLKETKEYKMAEKEWKNILNKAKDVIMKKGGEETARTLLMPFRGIASKSGVIQSLFAKKEVYLLFKKLLAAKDFSNALKLAGKYPFLTELDEYEKIQQMPKTFQQKAKEAMKNAEFAKVIQIGKTLAEFPRYKEEAEELMQQAKMYAVALRFYANKKYAKIYELVETHYFLEDTEIFNKIEESWQRVVLQAEHFAATGDIDSIKKVFENFLAIETKFPKIVQMVKMAYYTQLNKALINKEIDDNKIVAAFRKLVELLGVDEDIKELIKYAQAKRNIQIDLSGLPEGKLTPAGFKLLPERIIE